MAILRAMACFVDIGDDWRCLYLRNQLGTLEGPSICLATGNVSMRGSDCDPRVKLTMCPRRGKRMIPLWASSSAIIMRESTG